MQPVNFIQPDWDAPAQVKAYTTLRGTALSDDALKRLLPLPASPVWLKQTHSAVSVEGVPSSKECEADASFSREAGQVCAVLTADCLPILLCTPSANFVAAIHAGWRGLAKGIIENTLQHLNDPADCLVWLGPAIGPARFEVGPDVYQAFTAAHPESAAAFSPLNQDKWLADIYALAKIRLAKLGITRFYGGQYCTYSQDDLFYSYRRDKGTADRMASLIWLDRS